MKQIIMIIIISMSLCGGSYSTTHSYKKASHNTTINIRIKDLRVNNSIKYFSRHHQNKILQKYLQNSIPNKGRLSNSFSPKGHKLL